MTMAMRMACYIDGAAADDNDGDGDDEGENEKGLLLAVKSLLTILGTINGVMHPSITR